ncbi:MAG: 4Fe-4S binding protein [Oscillospiraceae bacterium]|nr:4Fe-4S binding protein [Oscillospiraceae bacterium]
MIRRIITIDEEKCNGCGLCAKACHEGAIGMVDGKAKLLREDYCDGLGDCLPACPMNAITFVEREAPAYNEAAVLAAKKAKEAAQPCGCPGSASRSIPENTGDAPAEVPSRLRNWPVQIKLAPVNAGYFDGADLLIAADCTAYAYGNFHSAFMAGKVTLIGCPKLDAVNYAEKLTQIFAHNDIRSITVTRMTVPCCGGLPFAVKNALAASGKDIPLHIVTISPDGTVIR